MKCTVLFLAGLLASSAASCVEFDPVEIVSAHNNWRNQVGVAGLSYSPALAVSAQMWAIHLKNTNQCNMRHSSGKYGENLYWASAWSNGVIQNVTPKQVVDSWAGEKVNFNEANNTCAEGKVCGHYTQVVWKKTTSVGCAVAVCDSNHQVWVCQYEPAGNWVGQRPF
ncbi:MAG: CAP domain-containing protein [Gallionella sp.]|nr:CAP domain-containing protein [Gallionella sp.]